MSPTAQSLTGAWITIGNSEDYAENDRCRIQPLESSEVSDPGAEVTVSCEQQVCGRYLTLINEYNPVRVCEVKVYAYQTFPHEGL